MKIIRKKNIVSTTFYFYAVTIFTPDDNAFAFNTEELVYSMLIFEWVTVVSRQMKKFQQGRAENNLHSMRG